MKILKWFLFSLFVLLTMFCCYVVYEFYTNLSFIDYPYLVGAFIFSSFAYLTFKYK